MARIPQRGKGRQRPCSAPGYLGENGANFGDRDGAAPAAMP